MNPSGATTTQIRNIYSPDANVQSPLNGGLVPPGGFLPPPPEKASPTLKNDRPNTLGSVIGVNPTINNNNNTTSTSTKGKKTRWLLCYPSGGTASSASPSPPNTLSMKRDAESFRPPRPLSPSGVLRFEPDFLAMKGDVLADLLVYITNLGPLMAEREATVMDG